MSTKLYLRRDASPLVAQPPAPTVDYGWLDWPLLRAMTTDLPTNPTGYNASASLLIGSVAKRHGVGRWAFGPLAAGSTINMQGFGLRFGSTQNMLAAQNWCAGRLALYLWRPSTPAVVKTLWANGAELPTAADPVAKWPDSNGPTLFQAIGKPQTSASVVAGWVAFDVGASDAETARVSDYTLRPTDLLAGDVANGDYLILEVGGDILPSDLSTHIYGFRFDGSSTGGVPNFASFIEFWSASLTIWDGKIGAVLLEIEPSAQAQELGSAATVLERGEGAELRVVPEALGMTARVHAAALRLSNASAQVMAIAQPSASVRALDDATTLTALGPVGALLARDENTSVVASGPTAILTELKE